MRLEPLSPGEVDVVLAGLHAAVDARPALALRPSFVGTLRLALTARGGVASSPAVPVAEVVAEAVEAPRPAEPPVVAEPAWVTRAREENEQLRAFGITLQEELRDARIKHARDEAALGLATTGLDALREDRDGLAGKLEEALRRNTQKDEEIARLTKEVKEANDGADKAENALVAEKEKATKAIGALEATRKMLLDGLRDLEFCGKSDTTFKSGNHIPCCPICFGWTTREGIDAKEWKMVGHRKTCWFGPRLAKILAAA